MSSFKIRRVETNRVIFSSKLGWITPCKVCYWLCSPLFFKQTCFLYFCLTPYFQISSVHVIFFFFLIYRKYKQTDHRAWALSPSAAKPMHTAECAFVCKLQKFLKYYSNSIHNPWAWTCKCVCPRFFWFMSVCSYMSLFVCIRRVHKQYLLVRTPRKYLMTALSTQLATLYSVRCSCCSHMPLTPSVSEVQGPLQLCLRSGAVGGPLTCRHGAFHCQCLPVSQPSWGASLTLWRPPHGWENTAHPDHVTPPHTEGWDDWEDVVGSLSSTLTYAGSLCNKRF